MTDAALRAKRARPFAALAALLLALAGAATPALAQEHESGAALEFATLEEKADEVVKVNLWGRSLDQAKRLLGLRKNVTASVRGFLGGLKGVYRRTYRFRGSPASEDDVRPVHESLSDNGWVPMIETADRKGPESLSVYSYYEDEELAGMTVVSSDPREVTVVKILGPVDLEALSQIGRGLGIPLMNVATTELSPVADPPPAK